MIRRRVVVTGRVQGVFYRDTCRREAVRAGVAGWVRNLRDGSVEAVFEGPDEGVERMLAWSKRGPRDAVVYTTTVDEEPPLGEQGFEIRPTPRE